MKRSILSRKPEPCQPVEKVRHSHPRQCAKTGNRVSILVPGLMNGKGCCALAFSTGCCLILSALLRFASAKSYRKKAVPSTVEQDPLGNGETQPLWYIIHPQHIEFCILLV